MKWKESTTVADKQHWYVDILMSCERKYLASWLNFQRMLGIMKACDDRKNLLKGLIVCLEKDLA